MFFLYSLLIIKNLDNNFLQIRLGTYLGVQN
jgi:hypothetical protein